MTPRAIETRYNGYRFRSRLEARWAVFFDAVGVRYEYEREGYDLGEAGWYLPDFWLPGQNAWVEIKPDVLPDLRVVQRQLYTLATVTESPALLICGGPWRGAYISFWWTWNIHPNEPCADTGDAIGFCDNCAQLVISGGIENGHLASKGAPARGDDGVCSGYIRANTLQLNQAYIAARSARFEHGQQG